MLRLICSSCQEKRVPAKGLVETTCITCHESLLSRHEGGYRHCCFCSQDYGVCMVCGELLSHKEKTDVIK